MNPPSTFNKSIYSTLRWQAVFSFCLNCLLYQFVVLSTVLVKNGDRKSHSRGIMFLTIKKSRWYLSTPENDIGWCEPMNFYSSREVCRMNRTASSSISSPTFFLSTNLHYFLPESVQNMHVYILIYIKYCRSLLPFFVNNLVVKYFRNISSHENISAALNHQRVSTNF